MPANIKTKNNSTPISRTSSNSNRRNSSNSIIKNPNNDDEVDISQDFTVNSFADSSIEFQVEGNMAVTNKNRTAFDSASPSKKNRSKMAMVVKKPPTDHSLSNLEGELTSFLSKQEQKITSPRSAEKNNPLDDGTTSTTSRTTKSSHGSKIQKSTHEKEKPESTRSKNSINPSDWDWSDHQTNDWMNIASSSHNGFERFPDFPDLAPDEHLRTLNDSDDHLSCDADDSPLSPTTGNNSSSRRSSGRKPHSSRRVQRQKEMQDAIACDERRRRLGETPYDGSGELRIPSHSHSERRGSKSRRSRSKDASGYNSIDSDDTPPSSSHHHTERRRSGTSGRRNSRTAGRSKSRDKSRDRSRHSGHHRSTSPTQTRRGSRRSSATKPRSKSIDAQTNATSSNHSRDEQIPYSSASRRGRRRCSLNGSATWGTGSSHDQRPSSAAQMYGYEPHTPSGSAHNSHSGHGHSKARSERGRRRSSLTHVSSSNPNVEPEPRKRGQSASARSSRRRSYNDHGPSVLDRSGHSRDSSVGDRGRNSHTHRDTTHPSKPQSYPNHRHRRRSRSSNNRRSRSKSIDRSARSLRADELLPERLNQMMKASTNHDSQLERLALAILVAEEGDGDLDQDIHDAVEKLPTHLLDPSKVRLNMQW